MAKTKTKKATAAPLSEAIHNVVPPVVPKAARRLRAKPAVEPPPADPIAELRRVVHEHRALKRLAVRFGQSVSDITIRETKEVIPTKVSPETVLDVQAVVKSINAQAERLVSKMRKLLRGIPIYDEFLSRVEGLGGPVTSAYLVAMVKIERTPRVSQLIRYCGFATDSRPMHGGKANPQYGKSERRHSGPKYAPDGSMTDAEGTYNQELKIALVVGFIMARQGLGAGEKRKPAKDGRESERANLMKYIRRWEEAKHTALTLPNPRTGEVMVKGADDKARRKATDLFLWDLYVMWRTLEGLTVRPDKYSAFRGRYHNGQEAIDAECVISLDEAKAMVFGATK